MFFFVLGNVVVREREESVKSFKLLAHLDSTTFDLFPGKLARKTLLRELLKNFAGSKRLS